MICALPRVHVRDGPLKLPHEFTVKGWAQKA